MHLSRVPACAEQMVAPLIASIPWSDWQFWTVSVLAALALAAILRPLLPSRDRKAACPGCATTPSAPATQLTVDGRRLR